MDGRMNAEIFSRKVRVQKIGHLKISLALAVNYQFGISKFGVVCDKEHLSVLLAKGICRCGDT